MTSAVKVKTNSSMNVSSINAQNFRTTNPKTQPNQTHDPSAYPRPNATCRN